MKARVTAVLLLALLLPAASSAERANDSPAANGRIVFVANGNGIASMNPDGSGVWGLMLGGADGEPTWSPDGSRLAVAVRWPGIEGITVMDPQGWRNRARITFGPNDSHPTWSPDGRRIAFSDGNDIVVVPAAGGAALRLTSGPETDVEPSWSPDGRTIAFVRQWDGGSNVWTLTVGEGGAALAVTGAPWATGPSWSPRGELTYVDGGTGFVRSAYGTIRPLVSPVDWSASVAWAPDGTQFLFVREGATWRANRDGSGLLRLVAGRSAAWQPLAPAPTGCTLWGTPSADILVGTRGDDVICGAGGNDTLIGLDGNDRLLGGSGNDWIAGGQGFDVLDGGNNDDRLDSRDGGTDTVKGGLGYDVGLLEPDDLRSGLERRRFDSDLAAWRPVQASGMGVPDPPEHAVDGRADDYWNAGGWPPQWIEIDLLRPTDIGRIRLVTGPQARGVTHLVLGKGPATRGAYRLLRVVRGPTAVAQEVILRPAHPWRGIRKLRIETRAGNQGAEWVSWHEVEVYAPATR